MALILPAVVLAAEGPKPLPSPTTKLETCVDKVPAAPLAGIELVKIPAGTVEVPPIKKDAQPQKVQIKSIWIGRTELTWDAYDPWWIQLDLTEEQKAKGVDAENRPSKPYGAPDRGFGHEGYPAISIAAHAAQMYCKWLSAKTGKQYRLATEAEWIYACQAGGPAVQIEKEALKKAAWFYDNSETESGDRQTHPVARKEPNAWGVYDMLGNVGEWVMGQDGKPVLMGGWYEQKAAKVHSAARAPYSEEWQMRDPQDPKSKWWLSDGPHVGFRIVRED
jgi:formylglycine-generating enzyme required for sulfatase activity